MTSFFGVCILTLEYPPSPSGGLAYHCFELSRGLSRKGFEVHVITHDPERRGSRVEEGVNVHRIFTWIHGNNFLNWIFIANCEFKREASGLFRSLSFDLIHAHDWLTVPAAVSLKHCFNIPMILTIHSTEEQRSLGIRSDYSYAVKVLEQVGVDESDRIIVINDGVAQSLLNYYFAQHRKLVVIQPFKEGWIDRVASLYELLSLARRGV